MVVRIVLVIATAILFTPSVGAQNIRIAVTTIQRNEEVSEDTAEIIRDSVISALLQQQQYVVIDSQFRSMDGIVDSDSTSSDYFQLSGVAWGHGSEYTLTLWLVDVGSATIAHADTVVLQAATIERSIAVWAEGLEFFLRQSRPVAFVGQRVGTPDTRIRVMLEEGSPSAAWQTFLEQYAVIDQEEELLRRIRFDYSEQLFQAAIRRTTSREERLRTFEAAVLLSVPEQSNQHSATVIESIQEYTLVASRERRAEMSSIARDFRRAERTSDITAATELTDSDAFRELAMYFVEEAADLLDRYRFMLWQRELNRSISLRNQNRFDEAAERILSAESILPGRTETWEVARANEASRLRFMERQIEDARELRWDRPRNREETYMFGAVQTTQFTDSLERFLISSGGFRGSLGWERLSPVGPFVRSIFGAGFSVSHWDGEQESLSYTWTNVTPGIHVGAAVGVERMELALRFAGQIGYIGGSRGVPSGDDQGFVSRVGPGLAVRVEIMTYIPQTNFRIGLALDRERMLWIPSVYTTHATSVGLTLGLSI